MRGSQQDSGATGGFDVFGKTAPGLLSRMILMAGAESWECCSGFAGFPLPDSEETARLTMCWFPCFLR